MAKDKNTDISEELPSSDEQVYHIPALLDECMEALDIQPGGIYADATFGGGGHSRAILAKLGPEGHLYGFDQDTDAMTNVPDDDRFTFVLSNFKYMRNFMRYHGVEKFDGIIADLGVSFHHFDDAERGFSFREDAPLDMRMNQKSEVTAENIINELDAEELESIFRRYTDISNPKKIVNAILEARGKSPVKTTRQLAETVNAVTPPNKTKSVLPQVFQALRICVNSEIRVLEDFLKSVPYMLKKGGRLVVLSYHSKEDRMVKNLFRTGNIGGYEYTDIFGNIVDNPWEPLKRSAISAKAEEVARNPRSRSARMRCGILKYTPEEIEEMKKERPVSPF